MSGLTVTFLNYQGITITIVLFAFDVIHTSGDLTLSPTRLDMKEVRIQSSRIIGYGLRSFGVNNGN
jgi:hypothetical protein